jgi:drug/metabolite transporter (DMT)-like permease
VFLSWSSAVVLLLNKCAFTGSLFILGIIFIQNIISLFLQCIIYQLSPSLRFELSWLKLKEWMPCAIFFGGIVIFSAKALSLIDIPTFSIFSNSLRMLVAALEYLLMKKGISRPQGFFLLMLMTAALIFGWNNLRFSLWGYLYAALHVVCIGLYSVYVTKLDAEFSSSLEMSMYNNAGSLPILFVTAMIENEYSSSSELLIQNTACIAASVPAPIMSYKTLALKNVFVAGTRDLDDQLEQFQLSALVRYCIVDDPEQLQHIASAAFELRYLQRRVFMGSSCRSSCQRHCKPGLLMYTVPAPLRASIAANFC